MLSFEDRKRDHIQISLSPQSQTLGASRLDQIELIHEALPEINFSEIDISTSLFGVALKTPLFVSSMTLGHSEAMGLNSRMAALCEQRGWAMGVGSQRRQLEDLEADQECRSLRRQYPKTVFLGNIGVSQLITHSMDQIQRLVDSLEANGLIVHTNPLQECIQPEGTPQFRGGLEALEKLCRTLSVPVILKETGCGFNTSTLKRLKNVGLAAVDVSGKGGTHWGRVEAERLSANDIKYSAGQTFANWGLSTVESLLSASEAKVECEIWASGGVRTGLDAAKLMALGAQRVGLAQPILKAALAGEDTLNQYMSSVEYELKVAMFCLGVSNLEGFKKSGLWKWN